MLNLFVVKVHAGPPPEDAHAVAHWREAVLLHPLRQNIRPGGQPQATHQGSHRGAPLQGQPVHICAKNNSSFSITLSPGICEKSISHFLKR